uniref:Uncharacterized protein n=1 Tax=Chromera velia CCMP2878 TaxID=1169474 RepID=A0A0G4HY28_9ALVE|eukprot:Cvel_9404.t1-p1 / transcript=Cvel_9404.t1 / gene=Cvel_9404 / organism=Chromera_velia_CCMP2878 / gene_product=Ankyrin repeat domain-containing protein 50, putative / transcript_product=Ankyrin repeat domain-containing protein 50, putative / location=Cvel_scaffold540:63021-68863(-) / protein_length=1443 / sequence_SO=supercontig / SO=protein_coding / is_pseudo=false
MGCSASTKKGDRAADLPNKDAHGQPRDAPQGASGARQFGTSAGEGTSGPREGLEGDSAEMKEAECEISHKPSPTPTALQRGPHPTGVDPAQSGAAGQLALLIAAGGGDLQTVKRKLEQGGTNVDVLDENGKTALICASDRGHAVIVQLLLDARANTDIQDQQDSGGGDLASFLFRRNIVTLRTALMYAASNGHTDIVRLLLKAKANVNIQDNRGHTALISASNPGHAEVVQLLIEAQTNVDCLDGKGKTALLCASSKGHTKIVQLLLITKANADIQDKADSEEEARAGQKDQQGWGVGAGGWGRGRHETLRTALMRAAYNGHTEIVRLLIEAKANLDLQDKRGRTALISASEAGHTEIVHLLINAKAELDRLSFTPDEYSLLRDGQETALIRASSKGHTDIVRLLIDAKADINAKSESGTALLRAASRSSEEIVRLLLEAGADVNISSESDRMTPLMYASGSGYSRIVPLLLNAKACVNTQDKRGTTALMWAASKGDTGHMRLRHEQENSSDHSDTMIVGLLIDSKATVDVRDEDGKTALMFASSKGHTDIVQKLLDAKAKADIQSRKRGKYGDEEGGGDTALACAAKGGHTGTVRVLLDARASVNILGTSGTALMYASHEGHTESVRLLLDAKADAEVKNEKGETALLLASESRRTGAVLLLLRAGCRQTDMNASGETPLMTAVKRGDLAMAELLLSSPFVTTAEMTAVDISDADGKTPLMRAASEGNILLVDLLICRGATLDVQQQQSGKTALAFAHEKGYVQVVERLRDGARMVDAWSNEMASDWNELKSLITSQAVVFWPVHLLISLLKADTRLPYRQKVAEVARALNVDCTPFSVSEMEEEVPHQIGAPFKLIAISYPWLSREHPDPEGFRLRSVVKQLEHHWWVQEGSPVKTFVFWDFMSLFQHPPGGRRTDAEDALFKQGLGKMDVIYSSSHTYVLRSTAVPKSAANATPYLDRGWCWFESAVTAFKPPGQVVTDNGAEEEDGQRSTALSHQVLRIPSTPLAFGHALDTKKFTNGKSDADPVKELYKGFLQRSVRKLHVFADGSWAPSENARKEMDHTASEQLAELVEYIAADSALRLMFQPQVLDLAGSKLNWVPQQQSSDSEEERILACSSLEPLLGAFGKLQSVTVLKLRPLVISRLSNRREALPVNLDAQDPFHGSIALACAASNGLTDTVQLLIDAKVNVNFQSDDGKTALMQAASHGQPHIVKLLIDAGANLDLQDSEGSSALIYASVSVLGGSCESTKAVVQLLLNAKANVNIQDTRGRTALMRASSHGVRRLDIVQVLLDAHADVNLQDEEGKTAVFNACNAEYYSLADILRVLLDAQPDVNVQDKRGWTPLILASRRGDPTSVQMLLDANAAVDIQGDGDTALLIASSCSPHIVPLLLNAKANPDIQDEKGSTALILAASQGHEEAVQLLLEVQAKPDVQNQHKRQP